MQRIYYQIPLYRFLQYCSEYDISRSVLDCGAGGELPPLALFYENGYAASGIDIDEAQVQKALCFVHRHQMQLHIQTGDMKRLPYEKDCFGDVYSYNSIFHMTKKDIAVALKEMKRVLKPQGLMFVNFLTTDDFRCGGGDTLGNHQYYQYDDDMPVIHSYFEETEADIWFSDMKLLFKERRIQHRIYRNEMIRQGFVDYILQKK